MAFNYSPKIVTDGLVLCLDAANPRSYVSGSTTWTDISRGGNNGTLVNGPTFNSANGGSIAFDGVNDYVNCGGNVKPIIQITVNTWIYFNTAPSTNLRCISDWHQSRSQDRWIFYSQTGGQITWYIYTNSESGNTPYTVPINTWINICGTYDSTIQGGANAQNFYIDGQLYNSKNASGTLVTGSSNNTIKLGGQVSAGGYFNGRISQTAIYNRALSASEILQNYNATKTRFGLT